MRRRGILASRGDVHMNRQRHQSRAMQVVDPDPSPLSALADALSPAMRSPGRKERRSRTSRTSVYRLFDADGLLLYVGITRQGHHRLHEHARDKAWWRDVASATFEHLPTRDAALRREAQAIHTEAPLYNIARPSIEDPRPRVFEGDPYATVSQAELLSSHERKARRRG